MHIGRRLVLLPLLLSLPFFLASNKHKIIFKGFCIQKPEVLLKDIPPGDIFIIKNKLEESGFFRTVEVVRENHETLVTVREYPRVRKRDLSGNSLYQPDEIFDFLNIELGRQFNNRKFNAGLKRLYRKTREDGYTHLSVEEIMVDLNGSVHIAINEGILREVVVEKNLIDQEIINRFFKSLLGRPFNSRRARYILEEILFTGAFYEVNSEVRRADGQVILIIKVEKKRLQGMKNSLEYSNYGGFKVSGKVNLIKQNTKIQFLDSRFDYFDSGDSKLFHLGSDHFDYRKPLQQNGFSTQFDFFYTAFADIKDFFLIVKHAYHLFVLENVCLSFFAEGGLNKNLSRLPNALIAETGVSLGYGFRSPLERSQFSLLFEYKYSWLEAYSNLKFRADLKTRFSFGEMKLSAQWNRFSGNEMGFNYNFIFPDQLGILTAEQIFSRDSRWVTGEINSKYFRGLVKIGLLGQYFSDLKSDYWLGFQTFWNLKGIPLNIVLFWHDHTPRIMARVLVAL
jgi:outer membrane protein assembly factor BamA